MDEDVYCTGGIVRVVKKKFQFGAKLILLCLLALFVLHQDTPTINAAVRLTEDLNQNGIVEEYRLSDHRLTIKEGEHLLWESPKDFRIDDFALGDPDNDGQPNLTISLWKTGSFGKIKPFWHTEEDKDYKNHLFVYKLEEDTLKPVWCSSNLANPIRSFGIKDIDGDGNNELVVNEGQYKEISEGIYSLDLSKQTKTTIWKWREWGFERSS